MRRIEMQETNRAPEPGDVVQLKSGGPLMTVHSVGASASGSMTAHCQWFEGAKQQQGNFPTNSLNVEDDS